MCISGSVGQGGRNAQIDVKTVQVMLNACGGAFGLATPLIEDGAAGPVTVAAIEGFQRRVIGLSSPSGCVEPGSATLLAMRDGLGVGFSKARLRGVMINAPEPGVVKYLGPLVSAMRQRDITTPLRQAHFLAQTGHESGELRYVEELASGDAYEGRRDLGNTQPGDGARFKGRGLIQLTGRANYQKYGEAIGKDLVTNGNWRLVADDAFLAVDVACWFWSLHGLNGFADQDDILTITKRINGGLNGLEDRRMLLTRGKFFVPSK